jgi:hypothetical protein
LAGEFSWGTVDEAFEGPTATTVEAITAALDHVTSLPTRDRPIMT